MKVTTSSREELKLVETKTNNKNENEKMKK